MLIHDRGPTPAQTPGRQGWRVDRVVWHHTGGGSVAGALSWVTRPGSNVGYHYLVDENGVIFRVASENNTAWHAGNWTWNLRSIGICHPVNGGGVATRNASVALTRDICRRWGISPSVHTIVPHRAIVPTLCPGSLPMNDWIHLVAHGGEVTPPEPRWKESSMILRDRSNGAMWLVDASGRRHLTPGEAHGWLAGGAPSVDVDPGTINDIPPSGQLTLLADESTGAIYVVDALGKRHIQPPEFRALQDTNMARVIRVASSVVAGIPDMAATLQP